MPERPDLRKISGNIREALSDCDRETLLDILTFVFKEYVVEGPPPLLVHQAERIQDLENLSFAELVTALQTRLDHPELSLFQVEGNEVSVRASGVMTLLSLPRGQAPGTPAPRAAAPEQPRPTPGVQVIETDVMRRPPSATGGARPSVDEAVARGRGDLAGVAREAAQQAARAEESAPPPRRGLSVRGRPGGGTMMPEPAREQPAGPQAAQQPASQGQGQGQAQPAQRDAAKPEPTGDDDSASTRFSLLELD